MQTTESTVSTVSEDLVQTGFLTRTKYNFEQDPEVIQMREAIQYLSEPSNSVEPRLLKESQELSEKVIQKINFIKGIQGALKIPMDNLLKVLKDSKIIKFFKVIKFSLSSLFEFVHKGFEVYRNVQKVISVYVHKHLKGVTKYTDKHLKALDEFLNEHKYIKRLTGIAVGALLLYVWLNIGFTADFNYDFDISDMIDAFMGKFSVHDVFGTPESLRMLLWLIGGSVGFSFPWVGAQSAQFVTALFYTLTKKKKLHQKLLKKVRR